MRKTSKKESDYNQFTCGSFKTFGDAKDARLAVIKFFNEYYSSNLMTLMVLG